MSRPEITGIRWKKRGIEKDSEFAILTNELTKAWSSLTVREYKEVMGLKKENLRDNMTNLELVLNMLAEVSRTGKTVISKLNANDKPALDVNDSE